MPICLFGFRNPDANATCHTCTERQAQARDSRVFWGFLTIALPQTSSSACRPATDSYPSNVASSSADVPHPLSWGKKALISLCHRAIIFPPKTHDSS